MMNRKKSIAKKKPEEVRVHSIVNLLHKPVIEPAELEPEPERTPESQPRSDSEPEPRAELEPEPESTGEWLDGVSELAKSLEIATAECARLAEKASTLAAELAEAEAQLLVKGEEIGMLREKALGAEKDIQSYQSDIADYQGAHERDQAVARAAGADRDAALHRVRELEGVLKQIHGFVSSALPEEEPGGDEESESGADLLPATSESGWNHEDSQEHASYGTGPGPSTKKVHSRP